MSSVEKLISECIDERLPGLVATAMVQGDTDVAGEALSWHVLITGPTGFLKRAGQRERKPGDDQPFSNNGRRALTYKCANAQQL